MNAIMIALYLAVLVVAIKIFFDFKNRRQYKLLKQFPSHPAYPFIGNLYKMLFVTKDTMLATLDEYIQAYDQQVMWIGPIPLLVLRKHEDIITVLTNNHERDLHDYQKEWVGDGMVNAKYEEAKKTRRIIGPAFCSQMLSRYTDAFNKYSLTLVEKFKPSAECGEVIDVFEYVVRANLDSIVENSVGELTEDIEERNKFSEYISEPFINITQRTFTIWQHSKLVYHLYLKITGKINVINLMFGMCNRIIKNKMKNYQTKCDLSDNADSNTSKNLADQLITAHYQESRFTEKEMTDELRLIFIAGVETTSLTSSFLMLMLAIHQNVQQKVYEEVAQLLSNSDTLTFDNLLIEMKYLEQCIKETIRLYSPVMATLRRTREECVLQDNKIVPANTHVALMIHWAHLDEDLYENPLEWDPEHYSEQAVQNRPKNSFVGFGHGLRCCLGDKYSLMSLKAQIARIVYNYHLSTNITTLERSDLSIDLSIRSKIGYPIKFTSRKKHPV